MKDVIIKISIKKGNEVIEITIPQKEFDLKEIFSVLRVEDYDKINSFFDGENIDNKISDFLHELGIPNNLKGYKYLIFSIKSIINDRNKEIVEIYRELAHKYKTSENAVEHAIKNAIRRSFRMGRLSLINNIFSYSIEGIPTNTQFILMVADKIIWQSVDFIKLNSYN